MQHVVALSGCAVVIRHWFEIDLGDASMEHGVRIELRELAPREHRGTESAAQLITADRPLWRADLFDRLADPPASFGVAHYHPEFSGNEPCPRRWDPHLSADPWSWLGGQFAMLGAGPDRRPWPVEPADAADLRKMAVAFVTLARQYGPERCRSAAECYALTRDAQDSVRLMIEYLRRPDLLDEAWVAPWRAAG